MRIRKSKCRAALATLWFVIGGGLFILFVVQTILGRYDDKADEAWAWFLPTIMPTLLLMVATFAAEITASQDKDPSIKPFIFFLSFGISLIYLTAVALVILLQPFAAAAFTEVMKQSNLFLGPFQGLVAGALGIFFIKARENT